MLIGNCFSVPGAIRSTGVDIDLAGSHLFFSTDFNSFTETDLAGNFIARTPVGGPGNCTPFTGTECIEDIALQQPSNISEPMSLVLLGSGLVTMAGATWRARRRK
jgi:hypothetical protein